MGSSVWRVMFLVEKYGRMTLTLDEVAEQIGVSASTIKNKRAKPNNMEFAWLRPDGRGLCADVADVAAYLEQRRTVHEATPA